jgi:hypothetical protein
MATMGYGTLERSETLLVFILFSGTVVASLQRA